MSRRFAQIAGFALLLLWWPQAPRAEVVTGLYAAQVPVADQSSTALAKASRTALSEVLVKVTGSVEVLRDPVISAALDDARARVQQYAFKRGEPPDEGLYVRIEFDRSWVTGLVIEAGVPLWTANRPAVLVWLVQDGPSGHQFVGPETAPELLADLRQAFSRRGVPLQLPLFDLADTAALPLDLAWSLDTPAVQNASARYNTQAVLAGRLARLSSGGVAGDWLFLLGEERSDQAFTVEDEAEFVRDGVAMVAETMAARYAVAASVADDAGIPMSVSGVNTYSDYAAIIQWLEGLELVERANVERVHGDTLQLRLLAQADVTQLATIIELNKRLLPIAPGVDQGQLNYRWQN